MLARYARSRSGRSIDRGGVRAHLKTLERDCLRRPGNHRQNESGDDRSPICRGIFGATDRAGTAGRSRTSRDHAVLAHQQFHGAPHGDCIACGSRPVRAVSATGVGPCDHVFVGSRQRGLCVGRRTPAVRGRASLVRAKVMAEYFRRAVPSNDDHVIKMATCATARAAGMAILSMKLLRRVW